jgi:hypothetical protein
MESSVHATEFLKYIPDENRDLHRELLERLKTLDSVDARPSARNPSCYNVFIHGLPNGSLQRQHVLRVQGGEHWKNRDLKVVWRAAKLGDATLAGDYKKLWESYVKSPDNPDASEVKGGLQQIGVSNVVQILRETAEQVRSSS